MSISIVDDDIFKVIGNLIAAAMPPLATKIRRGQNNRVSMPKGDFVVMTSGGKYRLSTNIDNYTDPVTVTGTKNMMVPTKYIIGLDFYGPNSGSYSMQMQAIFRDAWAAEQMPPDIQPLYADDPMQMPLINGEEQYEERWRLDAVLQYNPIVQVDQQFADQLAIANVIEVDTLTP